MLIEARQVITIFSVGKDCQKDFMQKNSPISGEGGWGGEYMFAFFSCLIEGALF